MHLFYAPPLCHDIRTITALRGPIGSPADPMPTDVRRKLRPLDTSTLHERAYLHLKEALMSGLFRPGEAVTLRGVSEALGVGVMPVREAVRRLVSERALQMPTARSIRVPPMSRQAFSDLCNVRALVEGEAAALAARKTSDVFLTRLSRTNEKFVSAAKAGDVKSMLAHNREFHFAMYREADNPLLLSMIESLWLQSGPYLHWLLDAPGGDQARLEADKGSHSKILDALRSKKPAQARAALQSDIFGAAELYREEFDGNQPNE